MVSEYLPELIGGGTLTGIGGAAFFILRKAQSEAVDVYRSTAKEMKEKVENLEREVLVLEVRLERLARPVRQLLSTLNGHIPAALRGDLEAALLPARLLGETDQP